MEILLTGWILGIVLEFLTHFQECRLCSQLCFWTAASFWNVSPSFFVFYLLFHKIGSLTSFVGDTGVSR